MNIKKGDNVKIMTGKDRNKTGKVVLVLPKENKIAVEGINIKKKNVRPKKQGQKGQVIQILAPFNSSNAIIVCPSCGKPTRIGKKIIDGEKIRFCKRCGAKI